MNMILLHRDDFVDTVADTVRLHGRRAEHMRTVHRATVGSRLVVGLAEGEIGEGVVIAQTQDAVDLHVRFTSPPPAPLPLTLVLAMPRPKVFNRVIAAATSLGLKRLYLINAWKVEKSYWKSPRLAPENVRLQIELGLEQAKDTVAPIIETRRLFRKFVEDELPQVSAGTLRLVAHPGGASECPRDVQRQTTLVIGPEGGFIDDEVASLQRIGFAAVHAGTRILRVETAIAAIVGRLF